MTLTVKDVKVPADVPPAMHDEYARNFVAMTKGTGHLMLFAGDQKLEHLNDDFFGTTSLGPIAEEDNDPEHLFRIASAGTIGVFAAQFGLIARYGRDYAKVPFLVKLNSKSHLVKTAQRDPQSPAWFSVEDVVELKSDSGLNILGVGYTIYLGSEFESEMLREAAQIVRDAHRNGLLSVIWCYPRGKAVKDETDPHLIAGAAGTAACLGSDFVKVNYPKKEGASSAEVFKEAIKAAGRTGVVTAGGSSKAPEDFLKQVHEQIHVSGAVGNATGRNIHQKPLADAVRYCDAISSITLGGKDVEFALKVYKGEEKFRM